MKRFALILSVFLSAACAGTAGGGMPAGADDDDVRTMAVEMLPDMSIPRSGHTLAYVAGELTAAGGHSTGFIPTLTAEYYRDGQWHLVNSFFPHDDGFSVVLPSGEILMGGGSAEPFGIGQTWSAEIYDPSAHTFSPTPILDSKRGALISAARLSDGRIIVAGNWYADDMISVYSPESGGEALRAPTLERASPLILQSSSDNALILSCIDTRGKAVEPVADRLKGEPFEVSLLNGFEEWSIIDGQQMSHFFIGDETVGGYAWLFPARRKSDGQICLITVVGEEFSVLETERPLPMVSPSGDTLSRYPIMLADRERKCAWLVSPIEGTGKIYVMKIGYGEALSGGKAPVTLFRAGLPDGILAPYSIWATLLPGGRIACAGGLTAPDNYHPSATAFILHTEPVQEATRQWWAIACVILLLAGAGIFAFYFSKLKNKQKASPESPMEELMKRIDEQMRIHHLYLKPGLTKEEVARVTGSNSRYISDCINSVAGSSFTEYVNGYRILHAQRLLFENPDMRLSQISEESGFSSEVTFYRNFKAMTGQTPSEWLAAQERL